MAHRFLDWQAGRLPYNIKSHLFIGEGLHVVSFAVAIVGQAHRLPRL
jgi:hypothetical protein